MRKGIQVLLAAAILLCFAIPMLSALDIVVPGKATPAQTVAARKFAMLSTAGNLADLNAKLAAGTFKAMGANARAIATVGAIVPLVYTDAFAAVYPVTGSKYFFKPGAFEDLQAKAQAMATVAEDVAKLADKEDKEGLQAQTSKIQQSCGACHGVYRGTY